MHFTWSWALMGLLIVPLLIALYLLFLRRKRKFAVQYASLSLIREALPGRSRWRRHLPFALLMLSIAALVLAFARPQATVTISTGRTSIILALDVSRSMCATDVDPNRMAVAQEAAREFVDDQPSGTRIGIVAFAGAAQVVVAPTDDKDRLVEAIEGLTTSVGTVIGGAILESIDALSEVNPEVAPSTVDLSDDEPSSEPRPPTGDYVPDIVVLLTDGANTRGIDPIDAAEQAADRRVRVYTIGFGTTDPGNLVCTPEQLGGEFGGQFGAPGGPGIGGSGPGGISQFLLIDEATLESIAEVTGGEYYAAENSDELVDVFEELPSRVVRQDEEREITVAFVAVGALLALGAVGLSLWWNRYP
jgi:Ca-activated chloride channel homolog